MSSPLAAGNVLTARVCVRGGLAHGDASDGDGGDDDRAHARARDHDDGCGGDDDDGGGVSSNDSPHQKMWRQVRFREALAPYLQLLVHLRPPLPHRASRNSSQSYRQEALAHPHTDWGCAVSACLEPAASAVSTDPSSFILMLTPIQLHLPMAPQTPLRSQVHRPCAAHIVEIRLHHALSH